MAYRQPTIREVLDEIRKVRGITEAEAYAGMSFHQLQNAVRGTRPLTKKYEPKVREWLWKKHRNSPIFAHIPQKPKKVRPKMGGMKSLRDVLKEKQQQNESSEQ